MILQALSKREKEILALLEKGASTKEIALQLGLKEVTIKTNLNNIFKKLRVTNRTEAILLVKE
jgi:LuxR family maltose regulon positive regulatory protein